MYILLPGIDVKAEMGGMRFLPKHQKLIDLLGELKIETRPFVQAGPNDQVYHLRGKHFR